MCLSPLLRTLFSCSPHLLHRSRPFPCGGTSTLACSPLPALCLGCAALPRPGGCAGMSSRRSYTRCFASLLPAGTTHSAVMRVLGTHAFNRTKKFRPTYCLILFLTSLPKDSAVHRGVTGGSPSQPCKMRGHPGCPLPCCLRQYRPLCFLPQTPYSASSFDTLWLNRFSSYTSTSG